MEDRLCDVMKADVPGEPTLGQSFDDRGHIVIVERAVINESLGSGAMGMCCSRAISSLCYRGGWRQRDRRFAIAARHRQRYPA